jgi:hypothetical protein
MLVLFLSAMTMRRYLLLSTLFCLFAATATAQSEFMNGYIIKHDGSRTDGHVKYIPKDYTPKECVFRWFDISNDFTFRPGDIEAFGFSYGMRYKTTTVRGDKIFMACLAEGEVDLFYDGKTMYLDGGGIQMVPLDKKPGTITLNGSEISFTDYRDLLRKLDPEGGLQIKDDLPLRPNEIKKVLEAYNRSRDTEVELFSTRNPTGVYEEMSNMGAYRNSFGIIAGMNGSKYSATKTSSSQSAFLPEMDFFEFTPVMGAFVSRRMTREKDLLALQAELMLFKTNVYMYDESSSYQGIFRSDINISYTGIKIPVFLQVRFLKGNLRSFINVGGFITQNIGAKYTREGELENVWHVVRTFTDNSLVLNKKVLGAMAGIGLRKELNPRQSIFIEARGEYGTGIYDRDGLNQKTISFNLIAGFDFL